MGFWQVTNKSIAEKDTLNKLVGYLGADVKQIYNAGELLTWINERLEEETTRLNKNFPDYR